MAAEPEGEALCDTGTAVWPRLGRYFKASLYSTQQIPCCVNLFTSSELNVFTQTRDLFTLDI